MEAGAFGVSGGRVLKGVALAFSIVQGPVPGPAQDTVENGALGLKKRTRNCNTHHCPGRE